MKIKLKLGVSEQKKEMVVTPEELGYSEADWDYMEDEERQRILLWFVDALKKQPYWILEQFTTL